VGKLIVDDHPDPLHPDEPPFGFAKPALPSGEPPCLGRPGYQPPTGYGLAASIHTALRKAAQEDRAGRDRPGQADRSPTARPEPSPGPHRPTVVRETDHRRVFSDDCRLPGNEGVPHKHPESHTGRAKLRALAKQLGLPTLPGEGSLTLAIRYLEGGRATFLQYVTLAATDEDEDAKTFLHVYLDLTKYEQKVVSLDDVCAAAGVSPVKLVKAIVGTAFEHGVDLANLIGAISHPKTVARTVKFAQQKDGIRDRELLLQHHGFVPTPKGATINIGVTSTSTSQATALSQATSVPSFAEDMADLQDSKLGVQHQLIEAQPVEGFDPVPVKEAVEAAWTQGDK
jgi:hypothetical protein